MKKFKILIFAIIFIVILSLGSTKVSADMGPKPSINITFENLEDKCYATLLSKYKSTGPYSAFDEKNDNIDDIYKCNESDISKEQYLKFINYKDTDGYYFLKLTWLLTKENNTIRWGYYPPSEFKILLYYPELDKFVCSEKMEKYAFDSYYLVNMENFTITTNEATTLPKAENNYDYFGEILSLITRIILTITVELLIALIFVYGKKKIFKGIVIINIITQVILNIILNIINYNSGTLSLIFAYIFLELLIIGLEAIAYCIIFTKSSEEINKPMLKGILYAVVANAASFAVGLILVNYLPFAF